MTVSNRTTRIDGWTEMEMRLDVAWDGYFSTSILDGWRKSDGMTILQEHDELTHTHTLLVGY